jgi:hypothetical protein
MVKNMMYTKGINFNKSICGVIMIGDPIPSPPEGVKAPEGAELQHLPAGGDLVKLASEMFDKVYAGKNFDDFVEERQKNFKDKTLKKKHGKDKSDRLNPPKREAIDETKYNSMK